LDFEIALLLFFWRAIDLAALNEKQQEVFGQFKDHRVVMQFTTGELVIAPGTNYRYAKVIDTTGQVYGYMEYMDTRDHRRRAEQRTQPLKPCGADCET
jgi:hypothetical protein